jgi:Flp pilus assembly protein TadD
MSSHGEESTGVVEIDAIGVDEWEHEQHTPRAMDENLAALVKSSAQSGPTRAPTIDDGWEADAGEPAKQRTTTNTVARPAPPKPKPKTKTMAMPTVAAVAKPAAAKPVAAKPAAAKPAAVPQVIARTETKAIVSPAAKPPATKPLAGDEPPPGFVEVKPLAARGAAKPAAKPVTKSTAELKPVAKPVAKPTPPPMAVIEAKPVAKPTPPPMAVIEAKPVAKPVAKPTPPPMAVIEAKPVAKPTPPPMPVIDAKPVVEPKPQRAATPAPLPPMTLPAWPPANGFEDWDNPQSAATSVSNRVSPSRPVSSDFKPEDSVIVDLNAKPAAAPTPPVEKPRRPQTAPVIQTSEQNPSTSGVFVMPTAAQPNATPVPPEAPELPPPPVVLAAAPPPPEGDRASSPGWNTPLPERLPGEPIAALAAPSWPSAAGLVYEPNAPIVHEPAAPLVARRAVFRSRGAVIGVAAAAVLAGVFAIAALGSHDSTGSKQATTVATSASKATAPTDSTATHATPSHADPMPAPAPAAAIEAVTPPTNVPAKKSVATRRFSRSRKPVVVDYDKKPSSPLDVDEALAQARAAYANGNQHLFAGEGREAVAEYRRALSDYPSYAAGYRGLGLAFAQLDDKPAAIAAFKTYVKLAPTAKDVALIQKRIRNLSAR